MRNKLIALLLIIVLATSACVLISCDDEQDIVDIPTSGASSTLATVPTSGTVADYSATDNLYIAHGNLISSGSFVGVSSGSSVSLGVEQTVNTTRTVIGDSVFKQTVSLSSFVKLAEQKYVDGNNYIIRTADSISSATDIDWADTATKVSEADYLALYGYTGTELSGMVLNDDTIISAELVFSSGGVYTYRYNLDCELATVYLLSEMKTSSGSSSYPEFTSASLVVSMDENWNIISVTTDNSYTVKLGVSFACTESITETFSQVGEVDSLPEGDFFAQYADADTETLAPAEQSTTDVLISMFGEYLFGEQLDMSVVAKVDGSSIVTGNISANIDIENLDNLSLYATLDSIDIAGISLDNIDVMYQDNSIYIQRDSTKGSTTVDSITEAIGTILTLMGSDSELSLDIDTAELLESIVISETSTRITATITDLAGLGVDISIRAYKGSDGYVLTDITATMGDVELLLKPIASWDTPVVEGSYPEITTVLDIVADGKLCFDIALPIDALNTTIDATVQIDLQTGVVEVLSSDVLGAELTAKFVDNTIYLQYGEVKLTATLDDIDSLMAMLATYIPELEGAELDLDLDIDSIIDSLALTSTNDSITLSATVLGIDLVVALGSQDGWTLDSITATIPDFGNITAVPAEYTAVDMGNLADYIPVVDVVEQLLPAIDELLNSTSQTIDISGTAVIDGTTVSYSGTVLLDDSNMSLTLLATDGTLTILDLDIVLYNGVLYLDINGIRTALDTSSIELGSTEELDLDSILAVVVDLLPSIEPLLDDVFAVIDTATSLDFTTIQYGELINSLTYIDGVLSVSLDGSILGLGDINLAISTDNNITVTLTNFSFSNITLDTTVVISNSANVTKPTGDYVLSFEVTVPVDALNTTIVAVVNLDLLNGTVEVYSNDVLGAELTAKFVDNTIYLQYGQIKLTATLDDIDSLMAMLATYIPELEEVELDLDLDIDSIIDSLALTSTSNSIQLSASILGIDLVVALGSENGWTLDSITATIPDFGNITAVPTEYTAVDMGNLADYIPVVDVVEQLLPAIDNLLNSTSQTIDISGTAVIDGTTVSYSGTVLLDDSNMSLTLLAKDGTLTILDLDIVMYNGILYLDINGIRTALDTSSIELGSTEELDLDAILDVVVDLLPSIEPLLDDVFAVIDTATSLDFTTIQYGELINSLTYIDGVLSVSLDGSILGLGDINLSIATDNNIAVTLTNFSFSNITLDTTVAIANSANVTKPTGDYVLSFEVTVPVDALDTTIVAVVNLDLLNGTVEVYSNDVLGAELTAKFVDNTIYLQYGEIKLTATLDDIDSLMAMLATYIPELEEVELDLDLDIDSIIDSLALTSTSNSIQLSASILGIDLIVALGSENGWSLDSITATIPDFGNITAVPTAYTAVDMGNLADYIPVVDVVEQLLPAIDELLNSTSHTIDISGTAVIDGTTVSYSGTVLLDGNNMSLVLLAKDGTLTILDLDIVLYNGVLYLDINGIRTALDTSSIELGSTEDLDLDAILDVVVDLLPSIEPLLDDVFAVIDTATSLDFTTIQYGELINSLTYIDGVLSVSLDGSILGLGDINLSIATDNNIAVTLSNFSFSDITLDTTVAIANSANVTKPTGDYVLSFEVTVPVEQLNTTIVAVINLDLLNGTVEVYSQDVLGAELTAKFVDNTIYLQYGEVKLTATLDDIDSLMAMLATYIPELEEVELDLDLDIDSIIDSLELTSTSNSIQLSASILGIDLVVALGSENGWSLDSITATIPDFGNITAVPTEYTAVDMGNLADYIPVVDVVEQLLPAIDELLNSTSQTIDISGTAVIDGTTVSYSGTVLLDDSNMSLQLVAKDGTLTILDLDIVLYNGILYLDINGIRTALDTSSIELGSTEELDLDAILDVVVDLLPSIEPLLDDVFAVIDTATSLDFTTIQYGELINSLTYIDGVLSVSLDGSILGLGDINLSITTDNNITVTLSNFSFSNITLDTTVAISNSANVTKPTGDYILSFEVTVPVEQLNTTIVAVVNLDLLNGTVEVYSDNVLGAELTAKFVDNTIYLQYGQIKLTATLDDIDSLMAMLATYIPELEEVELDLDLDSIIDSLELTSTSNSITLSANILGIDLIVALGSENGWSLDSITATIPDFGNITAVPTEYTAVDMGNLADYIPVVDVVEQLLPAIEDLLNSTSQTIDISGTAVIDGTTVSYSGTVLLDDSNMSLQLLAKDGTLTILDLDIVLYNGVLYLDINGIRTALDTSSIELGSTEDLDLDAILDVVVDLLPSIEPLLDDVFAVIDTATSLDFTTIQYGELINSLTYIDGVLSVSLDGSILGLGDINLSIATDNNIAVTLSNFSFSDITLDTTVAIANSANVTKPTGDYVLSFEVTVPVEQLNTTIVAVINLDLLNGTVEVYSDNVLGAELTAKFVDNTIYLQYGQIKLTATLDDIDSLMAMLATYIPELAQLDINSVIDIDSMLSGSININNTDSSIVLSLGSISITLAKGDLLTLDNIQATIGGITISATPNTNEVPTINTSDKFVSVSDIAGMLDSALQLVDSNSVSINIDSATVTIAGTVYTISGTVNISNGIELDLVLLQGTAKIATIDVAIVDGIAYINVNNIKLALDVATSSSSDSFQLDSLLGYHDTVDSILLAVIDIMDNIPALSDIDMSTLITAFDYSNSTLTATLDLSQFGMGAVDIAIGKSLTLNITNLSLTNANLAINFAGSVSSGTVVAPRDTADYTTDIVLVIDQYNTVYGNLDIYNNIYKFKLDDLYLEIDGRTFYISYGDLLCKGDVDEIEKYIDDLTAIVDEFFAEYATEVDTSSSVDILALLDIDIHEIIDSLTTSNDGSALTLCATISCIDITVSLSEGSIDIQLPLGSKNLQLYVDDSSAKYMTFTDSMQYVSIEQLFSDYMPLLEELVASNSWHFDVDMVVSIDGTSYMVDATLDLVYYNDDSYSIGADVVIYKYSGSTYTKYITIDFGLVDGRIYISYSNQSNNNVADNQLKLTVSLEAIEACVDVFGDVLDVVPQLAELIDGITDTLVQLGDQDEMNYSSILKHVSYTDDIFRVVIDANMLVNELGDIDLTVSKSGNSLMLGIYNFVYDNIVIEYANISVTAQDDTVGTDNIGTYNESSYNNLDSIEQLLSTFVVTADDTSFYISGTVDASVLGLVDLTVTIDLYVDILDTNGDGVDEVYIAAKIDRGQLSTTKALCFSDYGGASYLYYNGLTDTIRVVRDSYSRKVSWFTYVYTLDSADGSVGYDTGWMDSSVFMDSFVDYLLDMINFSSTIRSAIDDAISEGGDTSYGIEDIIGSYSYGNSTFAVVADLEPISSDLGTLYVNIVHDSTDTITRLYGSTDFLSGLVDLEYDLYLKTAVPNRAYTYASARTLF